MTASHEPDRNRTSSRLASLRPLVGWGVVYAAVLLSLLILTTPVAAQETGGGAAPTGGAGGSVDGWETILGNLYNVLYTTLQYAGLSILVFGLIVWFTARSNSQRSETGMKLTLGGGAMVIAYFGLGALISLLEFIAG
jgi:hypothetical protein